MSKEYRLVCDCCGKPSENGHIQYLTSFDAYDLTTRIDICDKCLFMLVGKLIDEVNNDEALANNSE
jgi:hypothetical protein